jgi:hypothetical protein
MKMMGDAGRKISFLKVDVEGSELMAVRNWILDDLVKNIDQMQIEFHTGKGHIKKYNVVSILSDLIEDLRDLYQLGFRSISYDANLCVQRSQDFETNSLNSYYNLFDIVLYKK